MKTRLKTSALFKLTIFSSLFYLASCHDNHRARWLVFPEDTQVAIGYSDDEFHAQTEEDFAYLNSSYYVPVTNAIADPDNPGFNKRLITAVEFDREASFPNVSSSHPDGSPLISTETQYWSTVDMRMGNGWNNWRLVTQQGYNYLKGKVTEDNTVIKEEDDNKYFRTTFKITKEDIVSPPAYLHLVVDSVFDFQSESSGFSILIPVEKRWVVQSITDISDGSDLTNDPDWTCYSDNVYTFRKNGSVKYEPGALACDIDTELANLGLDQIYQSFVIEPERVDFDNPGAITMTFEAPPANELGLEDYLVEITASDFNAVTFRITNGDGDQADVNIIPEE